MKGITDIVKEEIYSYLGLSHNLILRKKYVHIIILFLRKSTMILNNCWMQIIGQKIEHNKHI